MALASTTSETTLAAAPAFVGIDWGTTNRRAWLLDGQGRVLANERDDQGSLACKGRFPDALQALLARWPAAAGVPVVMAGMVGSSFGWQEVPYLDASVPLSALPRNLSPVRDAPGGVRWFIVPGLCWRGPGGRVDVMRGEETQLLGAAELAQADGWTVLPGTHSKWVLQQGGRVAVLRTYLTGELYASLRERGTLASLMAQQPAAGLQVASGVGKGKSPGPDGGQGEADFDAGVQALADEELSHALFGARARVMAAGAPAGSTAQYVSGLLMGAEWRDAVRRGLPVAAPVRLVGDPVLAARHVRCARHFGRQADMLDPEAVQLAAWRAIQRGLASA